MAASRRALELAHSENQRLHEDIVRQSAILDEILLSTAWKLTAPLRNYGHLKQKIRRISHALPAIAARAGGWHVLLRITYQAWRRGGLAEILPLARNQIISMEKPVPTPSAITEPEPCPFSSTEDSGNPVLLFVSHEASRTGAPVFLLNLIDVLIASSDIECIILLGSGGELESEFKKRGTSFVLNSRNDIPPAILAWLKKKNIRLVYSNTITNGMLQKRLKVLGCPILCHVHELAYSIDHYFDQASIQHVIDSTSLFLAGSRAVADYLIHRRMRPASEVVLAYPFINVEQAQRTAASAQTDSLVLPGNAFIIGACGTLGWRKGTNLFVQVARLVLEQCQQPIHFVWVGGPTSGNEFRQLQYEIETLGLGSHITFTGSVKAHLPYLARFDIFLLPSREDPFPLVVMDAAALSIPIICFSDAGGAPELVEDDAGIVVPYLDCTKMAGAVCQLQSNPDLRQRFGKRAQQKVMERHNISVGGQHIHNIITQQIAHSLGIPA